MIAVSSIESLPEGFSFVWKSVLNGMIEEPRHHFGGALARRKYGIEDVLNEPVAESLRVPAWL
jgi:hypothetical protein